MNRLQAEHQRLFLGPEVQCVVLELSGPTPWDGLAQVWHAVQADLDLPAPAIAVDGARAYQLWFSLAQPVTQEDAVGFLSWLCARCLPEVPRSRLALVPGEARRLPPFEASPGHWSAFVTPDLAALFADEPSLDMPPGNDAQADLLSRLRTTPLRDWERALQQRDAAPAPASTTTPTAPARQDPRAFLLAVMNDASVDLRLRIEAARALLPYSTG